MTDVLVLLLTVAPFVIALINAYPHFNLSPILRASEAPLLPSPLKDRSKTLRV